MNWNVDTLEELNKKLKGKSVLAVQVDGEDGPASLVLDDGVVVHFSLYAECCSESFFTDPSQWNELLGSVIQCVEERSECERIPAGHPTKDPECRDVESLWSFLVFTTNKGYVTIDWRNDSNGYYSGEVTVSYKEATK